MEQKPASRPADREPTDFHVAWMWTAVEAESLPRPHDDVPTLITRFRRRGIVDGVGHGRYRVNREHPELMG